MCRDCSFPEWTGVRVSLAKPPAGPAVGRDVPYWSGEAAIYSPEYLERMEGNARGSNLALWRLMPVT
jgi:hypothetical protein